MDRLHLRTSINDSGDEWLLFLAGGVRWLVGGGLLWICGGPWAAGLTK
jgi:hypothetical protein